MQKLYLLKNHSRRLLQGHAWIYSNEVDTKKSPLKNFTPGEQAQVYDAQAQCLGIAYVNPHSLITARLLTRQKILADDWIHVRLQNALRFREQFYAAPYYRLVYGESDALPGLVIDRYGDDFVVQINTAGMEVHLSNISSALVKLFHPRSILLRADSSMRALEQLPHRIETLYGTLPSHFTLIENETRFEVPCLEGQKTGWFYDHRENRALLKRLAPGKKVLDLFSYVGGWGIQAAVAGAAKVTCVDASALAIDYVKHNAALNQVAVEGIASDAFEALTQLKEKKEKFDIIIVDPPAFIKRRKDAEEGLKAYYRLNQQALRLLENQGTLISCSCSQHLAEETLQEVLYKSLAPLPLEGRIFSRGNQGFDHPVQPAMPETQYLKALFMEVAASSQTR